MPWAGVLRELVQIGEVEIRVEVGIEIRAEIRAEAGIKIGIKAGIEIGAEIGVEIGVEPREEGDGPAESVTEAVMGGERRPYGHFPGAVAHPPALGERRNDVEPAAATRSDRGIGRNRPCRSAAVGHFDGQPAALVDVPGRPDGPVASAGAQWPTMAPCVAE